MFNISLTIQSAQEKDKYVWERIVLQNKKCKQSGLLT